MNEHPAGINNIPVPNRTKQCLSGRELAGWLAGDLESAAADTHIDRCTECRSRLDTLLAEDGVIPVLRAIVRVHPSDGVPADAQARHFEEPPTQIDHYRITATIGRGGMGTVYEAVDEQLDRTVAIKVMQTNLLRHSSGHARFKRERMIAAKFQHDNICRVYAAGESEGRPYLVMERLQGESLDRYLKHTDGLPVSEACRLASSAARGLLQLKHEDVVHRDVKPSNLFLTDDGIVKLLDLGLSRINDGSDTQLTASGHVLGTVDYMAPEQHDSPESADYRADLYALGCTLFFLLTGRPPYRSRPEESAAEILYRHRHAPMPVLENIPRGLSQLLSRLMARNRDDRPEDVQAVIAELESHTEDESRAVVVPVAPDGQGWRLLRFGALVVLTLAAIVGGLAFFSDTGKDRQIPPNVEQVTAGSGDADSPASLIPAVTAKNLIFSASERELAEEQQLADAIDVDDYPVPFTDWLASRNRIVTVGRDGMYRTIGQAVTTLTSGEAVELLDVGPYEETLHCNLPSDTGIFSRVGSTIHGADMTVTGPKQSRQMHTIASTGTVRIAGLRFFADFPPQLAVMHLAGAGGSVLEHCCFTDTHAEFLDGPEAVVSTNSHEEQVCLVRNCAFSNVRLRLYHGRHLAPSDAETRPSLIVAHNHLSYGQRGSALAFIPLNDQGADKDSVRVAIGYNAVHYHSEHNYTPGDLCFRYTGTNHVSAVIRNNTCLSHRHFRIDGQPGADITISHNLGTQESCYIKRESTPHDAAATWASSFNLYGQKRMWKPEYCIVSSSDVIAEFDLLSKEPGHPGYMRMSIDEAKRLAADHQLPLNGFVGAVPYGPSPPDGDWLTRLVGSRGPK